jgi:RNA polymerase sigma-70 factor (ECF subfamily)
MVEDHDEGPWRPRGRQREEEPVLAQMTTAADEQSGEGAPQWLERLFHDHHERVFRAAYRVTGNSMDAEDVLQTVFLRLARRGGAPPLPESAGSYLHLAAVNGALDLVRARVSARSAPLDEFEMRLAGDPKDDPERIRSSRQLRERLRRARAGLAPRTAEIFVLRYFEGYGNREIAKMLGTSQGVVAVVLHRARRKLRDNMESTIGGRS